MISNSNLNILPVELFHHIFSYLSAHEIYDAFTNLNSYLDAVLTTYSHNRVNFKSISLNHFNLICQHLIPAQVIALTVSDDEDTPGLTSLFLTRFQIHQFIRLQALRLIGIEPKFLETIVSQMVTLKHIRSFCQQHADGNALDLPWVSNQPNYDPLQHERLLLNIYAPILPQISQLKLWYGHLSTTIEFSRLRHLVLGQTTIDTIKHIASTAPQLQSLETILPFDIRSTEVIPLMPQLKQLILRIYGGNYFAD